MLGGLLLATACAPKLQAGVDTLDNLAAVPGRMSMAESVNSSASADFLVGQFAMDTGDFVRAAETLGRALKADPDDLELRRQVFFLDVASGDFQAARAQARILIDLDPTADEPRLALFIDALRQGRLAEAGRQLDALPERSVGGLISPLLRAWLTVAKGDPAGALAGLPAPDPEDPLFAVLAYHRAAIQALAGAPAEALSSLMPLVQQEGMPTRAALLVIRLMDQVEGPKAVAEFLDGSLALQEQPAILGQAMKDLDAGRLPPTSLATPKEGVADTLIAIADALHQQAAGGRALVFARLAAWAAPDDGGVTLTVAGLMIDQNNPELAIETLASLPADSPWGWEGRLASADAMVAAGRSEDARRLLTRMVEERPERIDALAKLGDLDRSANDFEAAGQAYDLAIQRIGQPSARHWRMFYARGVVRERTGAWEGAVADFQEALRLEPDQPLVLNYLGYSWVDRGENLGTALGMLQKAVELRPRDGFIIDSLGWAYFKLGELDQAVTWLNRAVEAEPGDPVINEHLGDALWRAGRRREARFQWQRALSLSPDDDVARLLRDKLEHGLES